MEKFCASASVRLVPGGELIEVNRRLS